MGRDRRGNRGRKEGGRKEESEIFFDACACCLACVLYTTN